MEETRELGNSPDQGPAAPRRLWRELRVWLVELAVALAMAMFIVVFLFQPVNVEGTSMTPTLTNQEHLFINKFIYDFEPIQRGDVVVFWYPLDPAKSFIKRVIGLPGDTVTIRRGHVYVNGRELREAYVPKRYLGDESYPPVVVPKGEYYVMGDHRDDSYDSRSFGPVPRRYIYGKAVFAYWPLQRFGWIGENRAESRK